MTGIEFMKTEGNSSLFRIMEEMASYRPNDIILEFLDSKYFDKNQCKLTLTYYQIHTQALRISRWLQNSGIDMGARIILAYPPGLTFVPAMLGCIYGGFIPVPLYPLQSQREVDMVGAIAKDCSAAIGLTSNTCLHAARIFSQKDEILFGFKWMSVDDVLANESEPFCAEPVFGTTACYLQYTSGSTGQPKGVVITEANVLSSIAMIARVTESTIHDVNLSWLPHYHDMGLICNILTPLYVGAKSILLSPASIMRRPLQWLQLISKTQATISGGPNFAYNLCIRAAENGGFIEDLNLETWRLAFVGAEPIRHDTLNRFAVTFAPYGFSKPSLFPCYGLAEATLIVSGGKYSNSMAPPEILIDSVESKAASCGKVLEEQRVIVVDPSSKLPVYHLPGEIWVSGPNVGAGYWNKPDATMATFFAATAEGDGPFLRTGDIGVIENGDLYLTGRLKDIIIVRGRNIFPEDIERTIATHCPALFCRFGTIFTVDQDERKFIVVVFEVNGSEASAALAESIVSNVAQYHGITVDHVIFTRSNLLPRTTSGKIKRSACRDAYIQRKLVIVFEWRHYANFGSTMPSRKVSEEYSLEITDQHRCHVLQMLLIEIISAAINIHPSTISWNTRINSFGIDSICAMRILLEMQELVGITIDISSFYEGMTISEMARVFYIEMMNRLPPTELTQRLLILDSAFHGGESLF